MIDIPKLNTTANEDRFLEIFDDKLAAYVTMMDKVKDAMYGPGFGNYSNMPGTCLQVVEKITDGLINSTAHQYRDENAPAWAHPESSLHKLTLGDK